MGRIAVTYEMNGSIVTKEAGHYVEIVRADSILVILVHCHKGAHCQHE